MYRDRSSVFSKNDGVWYLVDAKDKVVGRVATVVASLLMGKNNPQYTPTTDSGGFVVVINADKVKFTGNKWKDKNYYSHSGHRGGLTTTAARDLLAKFPTRILEKAVKGMLPKSATGNRQLRKLKIFTGANHIHEAQRPKKVEL